MNNDLTNEINNYRGGRLINFTHGEIDRAVKHAMEEIMPGALNALQGLSSEEDGVTHVLWTQAVQAAEMDGSLVFPQFRNDTIPPDAEPVSLVVAVNGIAGRVARAILVVNGLDDYNA